MEYQQRYTVPAVILVHFSSPVPPSKSALFCSPASINSPKKPEPSEWFRNQLEWHTVERKQPLLPLWDFQQDQKLPHWMPVFLVPSLIPANRIEHQLKNLKTIRSVNEVQLNLALCTPNSPVMGLLNLGSQTSLPVLGMFDSWSCETKLNRG